MKHTTTPPREERRAKRNRAARRRRKEMRWPEEELQFVTIVERPLAKRRRDISAGDIVVFDAKYELLRQSHTMLEAFYEAGVEHWEGYVEVPSFQVLVERMPALEDILQRRIPD